MTSCENQQYGTKKSKERREEPLGTRSYETSSKRSPPFWLLIGARKTQVFWHQSEARTAATVWNWCGKTLSPGAPLAVLYFSSCHIFFRPFRVFLVPTICPWVSEDGEKRDKNNFFYLYFPHSPVLYLTAKFQHCSMRQSKVRAENVQHTRDLVVTTSQMFGNLSFTRRNLVNFFVQNLHFFSIEYFFQIYCILSSE